MAFKTAKLFDLTLDDLSADSIWVDAEYAVQFGAPPGLIDVSEDELVVSFPSDLLRQQIDDLHECGRFYSICEVLFADGSTYDGLAYIRAYDFFPYALDVFDSDRRLCVHLHDIEYFAQDLDLIRDSLGKSVDQVYPLRIHVRIEGLLEISQDYELPTSNE